MIIHQFNETIINQINDHEFYAGHVEYNKQKDKLSIIFLNDSQKTQFKAMIDKPVFDKENFELKNAELLNIFIKDYNQVFSAKYFDCAYIVLKEQNSDEQLKIRTKEVIAQ